MKNHIDEQCNECPITHSALEKNQSILEIQLKKMAMGVEAICWRGLCFTQGGVGGV